MPSPVVRRRIVAGAIVVLLIVGGALGVSGLRMVRGSAVGRLIGPGVLPGEPGYEAYVTPTPTLLLVHRHGAVLSDLTLLSLSFQDRGGAVLFIPVDTVVPVPGPAVEPPTTGPGGAAGTTATTAPRTTTTTAPAATTTLARIDAAAGGTGDAVVTAVEGLLRLAVDEVVAVDDAGLGTFLAPVAPLAVQLPDPIVEHDPPTTPRRTLWGAGTVRLGPDDIGRALVARASGVSDLGRQLRMQLVWQAWFTALGKAPPPVGADPPTGLARFLRGVAAGPNTVAALPVEPVAAAPDTTTPGGRFKEAFRVPDQRIDALVADLVAFPASPAVGVRPRVRLLDAAGGAGQGPVVLAAARALVAAGAEIVIIGVADPPAQGTSQVIAHGEDARTAAAALASVLAVAAPSVDPLPQDDIDTTIVVGEDRAGITTTTTRRQGTG